MSNYSVGNPAPEAFITKGKQREKQFNGTVYLKDGDNFEIELFNPKSTKVLAKISLDGKRISTAGIVLRPGERVFLERYIDSNNKFLFSTLTCLCPGTCSPLDKICRHGFTKVAR